MAREQKEKKKKPTVGECDPSAKGKIVGLVHDGDIPIGEARVTIRPKAKDQDKAEEIVALTDDNGCFQCTCDPGVYSVSCEAFVAMPPEEVKVESEQTTTVDVDVPVDLKLTFAAPRGEGQTPATLSEAVVSEGTVLTATAVHGLKGEPLKPLKFVWKARGGTIVEALEDQDQNEIHIQLDKVGRVEIGVTLTTEGSTREILSGAVLSTPRPALRVGPVPVTMRRTAAEVTKDLPLWIVIKKSTEAISFGNYLRFMDHVLCGEPLVEEELSAYELGKIPDKRAKFAALQQKRYLPFTDADAYRLLKVATEAFLMVNCGVVLPTFPFDDKDLAFVMQRVSVDVRGLDLGKLWDDYLEAVNGTPNQTIPYLAFIRDKLRDVRLKDALPGEGDPGLAEQCFGVLRTKLVEPCLLELIWSYWHEEGMLVQTVNAVSRRFQNIRGQSDRDPLANLEIDPLRPLNNLFWGYLQDEQHRLTVVRRTYEYDHHYGLRLFGKAVPELRTADSRSRFLEAFHNLLHLCSIFYNQDDDTTVIADGFPVLNALKEVHLLLSEGAHNQFGDLPSTARQEMLIQEWLLARPEFREFLPTRIMVAYPEPWMDRVDAMKKLQGWTDVSVLHFRNLGMFGEQILLSTRFGAWSDANDPAQAANWARFWRAEIQGYIHAYRAVTGVDLTTEPVDATLPAVRLRERLARQNVSR